MQQPHHAEFTIERRLEASPALAFSAFAQLERKKQWFGCDPTGKAVHELDFRVGGRETWEGQVHAHAHRNDTVYFDIIDNERIVYAYAMTWGGRRRSVSLTTITFASDGPGCLMRFHEQGVFFDGEADAIERERGTRIGLLEVYEEALKRFA
jgi:uncharacterized protein YndB with AHSA1/START domain